MSPSLSGTWDIPSIQMAHVSKTCGERAELTEIKVPKYSRDEILVKIMFSGVCHTDLHAWKGYWPAKPKDQLVGGHEGTGIVVAIGEDAKDISVGDRVGIQWVNRTCGVCEFCSRGAQPLCPNSELSGHTVNGTFQQYCVCKADNAVRIPPEIPLDKAAPILCAGVTVYKALKECNANSGQLVAIAGAGGGLGTLACKLAKAFGYRVLALSSGLTERRMCVEELDADYLVDHKSSSDVIDEIKTLTQGGPSAVVVSSADNKSVDQAIQYVRPGGTVVAVGLPPGCMSADILTAVLRNISIKGSYVGDRYETEEALEFVSREGIGIPYEVFSFHELPKVYELMEKGTMQGCAVLRVADHEMRLDMLPALTRRPTVPPQFQQTHYNLGTRLAYRLEELGVTDYFVVPGDFNLVLIDQLLQNKSLRMIGCCNELNAGYAADGYARSSPGRVAVVIVTFMVGGLSLINAIAGAYSEGLRVIVISGCPPQNTFGQNKLIHHTLGIKDRDQTMRAFTEVTALSVRLTTEHKPTETLDHAIRCCQDRSLPVYIEIPADIAQEPCEAPDLLQIDNPAPWQFSETSSTVDAIIDVWSASKQPILLVGAFVRQTVSVDVLVSFIDKLGCAVLVQPDGKSLVPEDHPQFLGTFWSCASEPSCERIVMDSDLWVLVGCRWTDYHTLGGIDIEGESHRIVDLQDRLVTLPDGTSFSGTPLNEMLCALARSEISYNDKTRPCHSTTSPAKQEVTEDGSKLSLSTILKGIHNMIQPGWAIIADTGDSWFNAQTIKLPRGVDYQMQMVYGSIGWSLPAALGYQLGRLDGRVILMIGDGSFQMTCQEISTMLRMRLNPIIFVFNNLGYAIETAIHDGPYNYYNNWNYALMATTLCNSFHALYDNPYFDQALPENCSNPLMFSAQIKTDADLAIALTRAKIEPQKLAFLECCIDPSDISGALRRFGAAVGGVTKAD